MVPASLSGTGKRHKAYFPTRDEAEGHAEVLKARIDPSGYLPVASPPEKSSRFEEAFKLLREVGEPFSLPEAVRQRAMLGSSGSCRTKSKELVEVENDLVQGRNYGKRGMKSLALY